MPGYRINCPYCKVSILSRDTGLHILKNHKRELFVDSNLKDLHRDKYLTKPLVLMIEDTPYYFCLADNSCIKNEFNADKHFKPRKDQHREAVLKLREAFPLPENQKDTPSPSSAPPPPLFTKKEKIWLEEEYAQLLSHIREIEDIAIKIGRKDRDERFEWTKKSLTLLSRIGINFDEETIKADYPNLFPDDQPKEEEEEEEDEEAQPPPEETPEITDDTTDTIYFNEKQIVSLKKTQERPISTLPKANYALAPKPQQQSVPQIKIISNTKHAPPRQN